MDEKFNVFLDNENRNNHHRDNSDEYFFEYKSAYAYAYISI